MKLKQNFHGENNNRQLNVFFDHLISQNLFRCELRHAVLMPVNVNVIQDVITARE